MSTATRSLLTIDTPMAPPAWAVMQRELLRSHAHAIEAFYAKYFDERGYLLCVPRWGGDDGADDAAENFTSWDHALRARRRPKHPGPLPERLGRPPAAVHRGQDGRGAVRPGRHVLQGVPGHVRLGPQRRGLQRLLPAGPLHPVRPALPGPHAPLRRLLHGRGPDRQELRPAPSGDPQHVQRQPRSAAAQGDGAGLDRRPHRDRGPLQARAPGDQLRADAGPLRRVQRRGRRPSAQPADHDPGDQRLHDRRRIQVPGLDHRVRGRLAGAHRRQRRHHPHQRGAGRLPGRRLRRPLVGRHLRLGLLDRRLPQPRHRRPTAPAPVHRAGARAGSATPCW